MSVQKIWERLQQEHVSILYFVCGLNEKEYNIDTGTPLQSSCLENPMDGGAWKAAVHGVAEGRTWLSNFSFTFQFHALKKEMATHSSVLAWRIPGTGEPRRLPSMGSHRVGHDWSDLAAATGFEKKKLIWNEIRGPWPVIFNPSTQMWYNCLINSKSYSFCSTNLTIMSVSVFIMLYYPRCYVFYMPTTKNHSYLYYFLQTLGLMQT